jgi:hypothetical protein
MLSSSDTIIQKSSETRDPVDLLTPATFIRVSSDKKSSLVENKGKEEEEFSCHLHMLTMKLCHLAVCAS